MLALSFDARRPRPIIRGRHRYALMRTESGKFALVDAACRHRGGPLDLGDLVGGNAAASLRCPWHQRCERLDRLHGRSLPLVIRDEARGTAIVPDDEPDDIGSPPRPCARAPAAERYHHHDIEGE